MFFQGFRILFLVLLGILTAIAVLGGSMMWTVTGPAFFALFVRILLDIQSGTAGQGRAVADPRIDQLVKALNERWLANRANAR